MQPRCGTQGPLPHIALLELQALSSLNKDHGKPGDVEYLHLRQGCPAFTSTSDVSQELCLSGSLFNVMVGLVELSFRGKAGQKPAGFRNRACKANQKAFFWGRQGLLRENE